MSSLSLTDTRDGTFDNLSIIYGEAVENVFDLFAFKADTANITGLPPATLNTLHELANAINDDPNFFNYVNQQLALKANSSDVYNKSFIDKIGRAHV